MFRLAGFVGCSGVRLCADAWGEWGGVIVASAFAALHQLLHSAAELHVTQMLPLIHWDCMRAINGEKKLIQPNAFIPFRIYVNLFGPHKFSLARLQITTKRTNGTETATPTTTKETYKEINEEEKREETKWTIERTNRKKKQLNERKPNKTNKKDVHLVGVFQTYTIHIFQSDIV